MEKMELWNALKQPPPTALKQIAAGRLKGKSDINPQWRYQAMTEILGPCGIGWKYEIVRLWTEPAPQEQVFAFAEIRVFIKNGEGWSEPIPGIGGSMLVEMESKGLHASDEGFKMAVTDALSVALKMVGVAADVYAGKWDGSKYINAKEETQCISKEQAEAIKALLKETDSDIKKFLGFLKAESIEKIPSTELSKAMTALNAKKKAAKEQPKQERNPGEGDQ